MNKGDKIRWNSKIIFLNSTLLMLNIASKVRNSWLYPHSHFAQETADH